MTAKRVVVWAGRLLAVLSLAYLGWSAARHWHDLGDWRPSGPALGMLVVLPFVHGAALLLVGLGWHQLAASFARRPLDRPNTIASFGVTQIAKYLPGNVFHYVGRHLWMSRRGVGHKALAMAMAWETIVLAGSALAVAAISILMSTIAPPVIAGQPSRFWAGLIIVASGCALAAALSASRRASGLRPMLPAPRALLATIAAHLGFLTTQGLIFAALFVAVDRPPVELAIAIACLSWLAGYVTPGAPGGIGSRELVLTTLATPLVGTASALILSALFRLVTTLGDIVCFLISRRLGAMPAEAAAT
jgi:hypothetical protein